MSEVVREYPAPGEKLRPAEHIRSTILLAAMAALKARGRFEAWSAALDPVSREALTTVIAGTWVPVELAMAHYRACDSLGLGHDEVVGIGQSVGTSAHANLFHVLKKVVSTIGATPWTLAEHYERLWTRAFDGGGFRIVRAGPKDSSIEVQRLPLSASSYFRAAFCGVNLSALSLVTTKCYVRVSTISRARDGFTIRVAWV
jgi:hypothetical protein